MNKNKINKKFGLNFAVVTMYSGVGQARISHLGIVINNRHQNRDRRLDFSLNIFRL